MANVVNPILAEVENSKIYVGKGAYNFEHPMEYIRPFVDEVSNYGATVTFEANEGSINRNDDETINVAYDRLLVRATFPDKYNLSVGADPFGQMATEMGMVFAFDVANPMFKVWTGKNVFACSNQMIFGQKEYYEHLFRNGKTGLFDKFKEFADLIETRNEQYATQIDKMQNKIMKYEDIQRFFGRMIEFGLDEPKLGTTAALNAIKDMRNKSTKYFIKDGETSEYNIYQALTQQTTHKTDVADKAAKTYLVRNLFDITLN